MKVSLKALLNKILTTINTMQTTLTSLALYKSGTGTITCTTGGVKTNITYVQKGYVVQTSGAVKATASISSGGNLAAGTIKGIPTPVGGVRTVSYYGDNACVSYMGTAGNFNVRNCGDDALAKDSDAALCWVYITNGNML